MGSTVIVQPGQCLEDIALQEYGSVDGVTWLFLDNEELLPNGYSTMIQAGMELALRDGHIDRAVYDAARRLGLLPASMAGQHEQVSVGDHSPVDYNDDHLNS